MLNNILILLYAVMAIALFISIIKKNTAFGFVYLFLFFYSVFTMNAYVNYPTRLSVVSYGQYYGESIFLRFYAYIFVFMLLTSVFFKMFMRVNKTHRSKVVNVKIKGGRELFYFILCVVLLYMLTKMITSFGASSYSNQSILKSNKIWFYLFEFSGIVVVTLVNLIIREKRTYGKIRPDYIGFLVAYSGVLLGTSFMFGQRIEILMTLLGIVVMLMEYSRSDKKDNRLRIGKMIKTGIPILFLALFIFQFIRSYRGSNISSYEISVGGTIERVFSSLGDLEYFTFQDWLLPSLNLVTCMNFNYIHPFEVLSANVFNLFSFITRTSISLTSPIRDLFAPGSKMGFGFYFPTEGFIVCGDAGCILSAFLIALYYRLYNTWFSVEEDKDLNCFLQGLLGFFIISLVRSYSLFFIKGILYYIIPGLVLYVLATGKTIRIRSRNANKHNNVSL